MKIDIKENSFEKRINPRTFYSGHILFASPNGFCEGRLINFSRYGLFIETPVCLSVGEIITIALPYLEGKNIKCKGQIIRSNKIGYGIELFRKRINTNFGIIKCAA